MNKTELGLVVTVALAILGGVLFIGKMDGRLTAIENDKDFASIEEKKDQALSDLNTDYIEYSDKLNDMASNISKKSLELGNMIEEKVAGQIAAVREYTIPKGGLLLLSTKHQCPGKSKTVAISSIQIAKKHKSQYQASLQVSRDTTWNASGNYDGRLFKTCLF